jgi:chromosome partitioning protein
MTLVLACAGQKGGGGKSLIARSIATEMASKKRSAVLVDLDVGQHTAADWNAAREANRITPPVKVVTVDPDEEPDFRIAELSRDHDIIILDAPGFSDEMTLDLAVMADVVVLPAGPSTDDLRPTMRLYHELVQGGLEPDRIVIVLNRIRTEPEEKFAREYLRAGGLEALADGLQDMPIYRKAANVGKAPTEYGPDDARTRVQKVVSAIMKRAEKIRKRPARKGASTEGRPRRFVVEEGEKW